MLGGIGLATSSSASAQSFLRSRKHHDSLFQPDYLADHVSPGRLVLDARPHRTSPEATERLRSIARH
jgi:hypothetical protein